MKKKIALLLVALLVLSIPLTGAYAEGETVALTGLTVDGGALSPAFSPDTKDYSVTLPAGTESAKVTAQAAAGLIISFNGTADDGDGIIDIALATPETPVKVSVSDGTQTADYTLTIKVDKGNTTQLGALSFAQAPITPAFNPDVYGYSASVTYNTATANISFALVNPSSTCKVYLNGADQGDNRTLALAYGSNAITLDVKSKQGHAATYTVTFFRETPGSSGTMSDLEKKFVETAFRLMPERSPILLAYQEAHGIKINTYSTTINGVHLSGVPFSYHCNGHVTGYDSRWWKPTKDSKYPVWGLDCAEYVHWVYHNMGYEIPRSSTGVFFAGIAGVQRYTPPVKKTHWVIPTLADAKIGDIVYNSKKNTYESGHGSHSGIFMGTARKLGIADTLAKYMPNFPMDAYLVIDIGWADGKFYYNEMRGLRIRGRVGMCGVGIQYFPSVKGNDGKYIYASPYRNRKTRVMRWRDPVSGQTFEVSSSMERQGRPFQYKPSKKSPVQYLLNISRPILRND